MRSGSEAQSGSSKSQRGFSVAWIFLFGLWVVMSGKIDAFHLGTGITVIAFIAWQHAKLPATPGSDQQRIRSGRAVLYLFWLFWQIILSAVYVARVVINPKKLLDPRVIEFRSEQPTLLSSVIFANSITATPGTVTMDLEDNRYVVHALTPETADGVLDGDMAARVARLTSDTPIAPPKELSREEAATS